MPIRTVLLLVLVAVPCGQRTLAVSPRSALATQGDIARARETKDVFAIYLVAGPVPPGVIAHGEGDWSRVRLSDSPLFTGEDIIDYDFAKHAMRLRPEALARIPHAPVSGTPFVVVANGERIYVGAFVTALSSFSCAVPAILVDRRPLDPSQPKDILVIDRAYPSASFGAGRDPRGDDRIKAALIALHKLHGER